MSDSNGSAFIALMIGELPYQPTLNQISTKIVEHTVDLWRQAPGSLLVCESTPMSELAARLGVPSEQLHTALTTKSGHTTRGVAEWLRHAPETIRGRPLRVVTHRFHAQRARSVFAKIGLHGDFVGVDVRFDPHDHDWKLRTPLRFRLYNALAHVYCVVRGWV